MSGALIAPFWRVGLFSLDFHAYKHGVDTVGVIE